MQPKVRHRHSDFETTSASTTTNILGLTGVGNMSVMQASSEVNALAGKAAPSHAAKPSKGPTKKPSKRIAGKAKSGHHILFRKLASAAADAERREAQAAAKETDASRAAKAERERQKKEEERRSNKVLVSCVY